MKRISKDSQGFTLIEMLIVVVIIGILASVAIPSYNQFLQDGRRAEGQSALLDLAARQEQFFLENRTYTNNLANLGLPAPFNTENGFYRITIACPQDANANANCTTMYTATATAQNAQAGAGNISYNALGQRSANWDG